MSRFTSPCVLLQLTERCELILAYWPGWVRLRPVVDHPGKFRSILVARLSKLATLQPSSGIALSSNLLCAIARIGFAVSDGRVRAPKQVVFQLSRIRSADFSSGSIALFCRSLRLTGFSFFKTNHHYVLGINANLNLGCRKRGPACVCAEVPTVRCD